MTEEEAKKKWCPEVRFGDTARNRNYNEGAMLQAFACIASDCMKWPECKSWWEKMEGNP